MGNQPRNAFPVSSDRFSRVKNQTPDIGAYNPRHNFNDKITAEAKNYGSTRFGKDKSSFVDTLWGVKDRATTPAPGHYLAFSDFSGAH
jgi:hypothetical protein